ncbi:MAG: glycosyltransferase family 8 protein [Rickettsiales bacterium]|nr:MAG: glycosyltransferase family 8 protein [Rickettsiales bacterium]
MTNNIPIFLSSDDNFSPYLATTIASICYNTKSFIDFYILDGGITNFHKKQIESMKDKFANFSIEFLKIDEDKIFKGFATNKEISLSSYNRLLIPQLTTLDKVIYLDADIILFDDIQKLWNEDLENYSVGAIFDIFNSHKKIKIDIPKEHKYFNAGVLLIDCKKWRENNSINDFFKIQKEKFIVYHDQDILNIHFSTNNYKLLDLKYNIPSLVADKDYLHYYGFTNEYLEEQRKNIVIRHFTWTKPWNDNKIESTKMENFSEWWFFAQMTPFYQMLKIKQEETIYDMNNNTKKMVKLFDFIPLLKIKSKENRTKVYLFGFIPLLKIKKI